MESNIFQSKMHQQEVLEDLYWKSYIMLAKIPSANCKLQSNEVDFRELTNLA